MKISESLQKFIESEIFNSLLDKEDMEQIYFKVDPTMRGSLTELFLRCGINPLDYMTEVPDRFAYEFDFRGVDFKIPSGVEKIDSYAFLYCNMTSITIPASVTSIGDYAFWNCHNLTNITFAENSQLTSIGEHAFQYCSNLTSITIPASVTSIGKYVFYGCNKLNDIYYQGTREQWLSLSPHNDAGRTIHCSDGDIFL